MYKKVLVFSLSLMTFFGYGTFVFLGFNGLEKSQPSVLDDSTYSGQEFINDMQTIYNNSTENFSHSSNDSNGYYLTYDSSSKVYNLYIDVDFNYDANIYSAANNLWLVQDSTFNGNSNSIINRYNKASLEESFWLFSNDKTDSQESLNFGLFDNTNGADVYNLTFDNSPFAFGTISSGSQIKNVNMKNVNIDSLSVTLSSSQYSNSVKKQYVVPIYALFIEGADLNAENQTIISNFYISNISFSNNVFNLQNTQSSSPITSADNNVGISFGTFGKLFTKPGNSYTTIKDAEIYNINVNNNQINADFINTEILNSSMPITTFSFTPLVVSGGSSDELDSSDNVLKENDQWDASYESDFFNTQSKTAKGDEISFKNIYIHDLSFQNNQIKENNDLTKNQTTYFNIQTIFNQQGFSIQNLNNIVVDNIQVDSKVDVTTFNTTNASTTSFANGNVIWSNSNNTSQAVNQFTSSEDWQEQENWSKNSSKKVDNNFSSNYWNTNDNEELKLIYSSTVSKPEITFSNNLQTGDLMMKVVINLYNYQLFPSSNATIKIVESNGSVIYSEQITNSKQEFQINIDSLDLQSTNSYYLEINAFNNVEKDFKTSLNDLLKNSWTFNNFNNSYNSIKNQLTVQFDLSDPLNQIEKVKVNLYNDNRDLVSYIELSTNTKTNSSYTGNFNQSQTQITQSYFLTLQVQVGGQYLDVSTDSNTINYGETNYLLVKNNSFSSFTSTWWFILIMSLLALMIIILITLFILWMISRNKQLKSKANQKQKVAPKVSPKITPNYDSYDSSFAYEDGVNSEYDYYDSKINYDWEPLPENDNYDEYGSFSKQDQLYKDENVRNFIEKESIERPKKN